jgi:hypothetical protein
MIIRRVISWHLLLIGKVAMSLVWMTYLTKVNRLRVILMRRLTYKWLIISFLKNVLN